MSTGSENVRLSLSMIVKNEERFLEGCLRSVEGIVDEIVIVDTGSTDGTEEIAQSFGATVIPFEWNNDFSAARNESLNHTTGEWILYLDADERLAEGQTEALRSLIQNTKTGAYRLIVRSEHQLPSGVIQQLNPYPRLFRRHPAIRFEGKIHEQIGPSIEQLGLKILPSTIVIDHLGYAQAEEVVTQKCLRNIALLRQELDAHPDDWYARFQLGNTLVVLQRFDEARPEFERSLLSHAVPPGIRSTILNLLAEIATRWGKGDEALRHCRESLRYAPQQIMARWFAAAAHITLGNFSDAVRELHGVLDLILRAGDHPLMDIAYDITVTPAQVLSQIGRCHERNREHQKAANAFMRALKENHHSTEALQGVARVQGFLPDPKSVITQVETVWDARPPSPELHVALARMYRNIGDNEASTKHVHQAITLDPVNAQAYALAAQWSLEDGDIKAAEEVLSKAVMKGVTSRELDKTSLDLAVRTGNIPQALYHLDKMISMLPPENLSLKNRLASVAAKLAAQSRVT